MEHSVNSNGLSLEGHHFLVKQSSEVDQMFDVETQNKLIAGAVFFDIRRSKI